ncbi:MAG TPA: cytochrome P450 [Acidimicrobiales bacterium]|nr:cytochrome P450 [Acidimicrobiales bacterium]
MTDTVATPADLDAVLASIFLTPEGKADPYPGYATVRETTALHHSAFGVGIASRYEDCQAMLRDNRLGRGENTIDASIFGLTDEEFDERFPARNALNESMLGMDPPDHTRLRALVAKAFTPKTVKALEPQIQRIADDLLESLEGEVDVMPAIALKLPITVIGEMLGVPQADHATLLPHIKVVIRSLATFQPNLQDFSEIYDASIVIGDYFRSLAAQKRADPGDDMFTELIHAEEEGDKLSEDELIATVILLFVAGYETTTNLIGNGLRAFLLHPDQLQRVRADRSLLKGAVEEILRYDSPVQLTGRRVLEAGVELDGEPLEIGTEIITVLGAANRDPRVYDDPDRFDVGRPGPSALSFSAGIHFCLGAALARAEGHIVFNSLVERYRSIEPAWSDDDPPTYRDSLVLRGLEGLPVRLLR